LGHFFCLFDKHRDKIVSLAQKFPQQLYLAQWLLQHERSRIASIGCFRDVPAKRRIFIGSVAMKV
jgi:hypothetical protein